MTPIQYNSGLISVALISVNIDMNLADEIAESVLKMSWAVHRADCEGYISAVSAPFSQPVKSSPACIAVIDFDKDAEQAAASAAYIQEIFAGKAVIVALSASRDPDLLLRAMRAGCSEFIGAEFDEAAFSEMLVRLYQQWSREVRAHRRAWGRGDIFRGQGRSGDHNAGRASGHVSGAMPPEEDIIDRQPSAVGARVHLSWHRWQPVPLQRTGAEPETAGQRSVARLHCDPFQRA